VYGLYDALPFIGPEPGRCDAGIRDIEDGDREGLEVGCCGDGEVYNLFSLALQHYTARDVGADVLVCW
jgi:hypothetical protein